MNVAASTGQAAAPLAMLRLMLRLQLQPHADLHPSWLPADWPVRHRRLQRMGPGAQAALADWRLRSSTPAVDLNFDARRKRLALIDGKSLRRLAIYCGLCAHASLLRVRGPAGAQVRRQARRIDRDAQHIVLERLPSLDSLKIDARRIEERPMCAGRLIVTRGYRLLFGAVAAEGEEVLQRLQCKLPRRVALLGAAPLKPRQLNQLTELMLMGIVPERLPQWDWLF